MNLEFKGLIDKSNLEKDINQLDQILKDNEYAIIIEDGVGKYLVFDIEYAKKHLELKNSRTSSKVNEKSPYTLVESMILTLEEIREKKMTAITLSSLVEKYYGKKVSPVIIRTRAEENANDQGEVNYFTIEPGNMIGLSKNSSFKLYIYNKMKRAIEYELNKLFRKNDHIELNTALYRINRITSSALYQKYTKDFTNKDALKLILSFNKYKIDNNYISQSN
ncbi:hypothetical protein KHQ89_07245 [Mycoplasmatota bacterium]|nr:hypothetical protein KHQ89_07245 [Mycoplasmatota bacterium]